jgi:hypothetical protein
MRGEFVVEQLEGPHQFDGVSAGGPVLRVPTELVVEERGSRRWGNACCFCQSVVADGFQVQAVATAAPPTIPAATATARRARPRRSLAPSWSASAVRPGPWPGVPLPWLPGGHSLRGHGAAHREALRPVADPGLSRLSAHRGGPVRRTRGVPLVHVRRSRVPAPGRVHSGRGPPPRALRLQGVAPGRGRNDEGRSPPVPTPCRLTTAGTKSEPFSTLRSQSLFLPADRICEQASLGVGSASVSRALAFLSASHE